MIKWSNREQQVLRQLRIGSDINKEYTQQPGLRARYGFLMARANAEASRLKELVAQVEIDISEDIERRMRRRRSDEQDAEAIRIYRWEIEREVKRDPRRLRVLKDYRNAKLDAEILKQAVTSLEHRKEMLINLGANMREEHGSYISLLQQEAADRLKSSRKG